MALLDMGQVSVQEMHGSHGALVDLLPVPERGILDQIIPEHLDRILAVQEQGLERLDLGLVFGVLQLVGELLFPEEEATDLFLFHRHLAAAPIHL